MQYQPETGMDYQVARIKLNDGRIFDRVVIIGGIVYEVNGSSSIPFSESDEIIEIKVHTGLEYRPAPSTREPE